MARKKKMKKMKISVNKKKKKKKKNVGKKGRTPTAQNFIKNLVQNSLSQGLNPTFIKI